ncbi:MAG: excinuclease ABC subunit UvrA [Acidobacteriota bacterium]
MTAPTARSTPELRVTGASTHNLKSVDCRIPHGAVTVVTGVSGAGKSSLAFDTIYAEAQRRYVESMSTYVRQFLEQMERPPVDAIDNVLPAVALEAKNAIRNARSTVGTLTDIHDVLRLLFTHAGEVACPNGHGAVVARGPQAVADALIERFDGEKVTLLVDLDRPKRLANDKLRELVRQGYFRRLGDDGELVRMTPKDRWTKVLDPLVLALGRFTIRDGNRARLVGAVEEGYLLGAGRIRAWRTDAAADDPATIVHFGRGLTCETCGSRMERPVPALFSFNSPLGACSECQGFGRVTGIDRARVIPDPSKSLDERPIAPWNTPKRQRYYAPLLRACREHGIPTNVPIEALSDDDREFLWSGTGFTSLGRFFSRLETKKYKVHVRVLLARYRAYEPCPSCDGRRLRPEALAVTVRGEDLASLSARSVDALHAWIDASDEDAFHGAAEHLAAQLRDQLDTLQRVGLGYLTLGRQARTLSGGESQRIQLASALGSALTGTLYVLDEPTIGLHPRDSERLLAILRDLASRGNTVLVVEHDRTLIEGADHVIDLGPRAGEHGGEILAEGPLDTILAAEHSLTARYLRPEVETLEPSESADASDGQRVTIRGARAHNLRGFDVTFPLGQLVAVTGVSGSGKSTLIENVLHGTVQRAKGVVDVEPGECDGIDGLDGIEDVVLVDQRPLGRSSRSNPVTYVKAYDEIRKLYASTPDAVRRGVTAGHFSFNVDKGRCPECKGTGTVEVDMHFMAPVSVVCDSCRGRRFVTDVLAVKLRGRSIDETLDLTVDEAVAEFSDQKRLVKKLRCLVDAGLGYLRLGQSTSTLSGGEAQRLKLASFLDLSPRAGRHLFLFDEPTTGLHLADIDLLHGTLRRLLDRGHGVVIVEHATDLVARADWIIDLGPGGGDRGGELLWSGPIRGFLGQVDSPTAEILREHMGSLAVG